MQIYRKMKILCVSVWNSTSPNANFPTKSTVCECEYAHLHTNMHNCAYVCACIALDRLLMANVSRRWCDQSYRNEFDMQKPRASAAFWHQLLMISQRHCEADEATDLWVPEPRGFSMGLMCEESQLKIIVAETWGMKAVQPEPRDHRWRGLGFWKARLLVGMGIKTLRAGLDQGLGTRSTWWFLTLCYLKFTTVDSSLGQRDVMHKAVTQGSFQIHIFYIEINIYQNYFIYMQVQACLRQHCNMSSGL